MNIRSANTRLLVSDLEACFLFYRDVMEFTVTMDDLDGGYAEFKVGGLELGLFRRQEMARMIGNAHKPASTESQDDVALILTVHDVDEEYHQLQHKGVKFAVAPWNNPTYGIKTAYLRDPDGNLIGLFQMI